MIEMQMTEGAFIDIHETLSHIIIKSENNVRNLLCVSAKESHGARSAPSPGRLKDSLS